MKVVVLAGGFGTRISEESHLKPKPMIEIGEKPILWHIMKEYSAYGINEFIICAGYKQHVIKEWFADYFIHTSDITFDFTKGKYDLYLVGSDQVWNITLTGNDKTFFCDFAMPESICCSYAASIGSSAFSNEELQNYKQLIDRFALISFREKELVSIFEKIASEKKICSVVDPVFLLKQDEWNTMARQQHRA